MFLHPKNSPVRSFVSHVSAGIVLSFSLRSQGKWRSFTNASTVRKGFWRWIQIAPLKWAEVVISKSLTIWKCHLLWWMQGFVWTQSTQIIVVLNDVTPNCSSYIYIYMEPRVLEFSSLIRYYEASKSWKWNCACETGFLIFGFHLIEDTYLMIWFQLQATWGTTYLSIFTRKLRNYGQYQRPSKISVKQASQLNI